jgi:hypothetical protein
MGLFSGNQFFPGATNPGFPGQQQVGNPFTPMVPFGGYGRAGSSMAVPFAPLVMPQQTPQYGPMHGATAGSPAMAPLPNTKAFGSSGNSLEGTVRDDGRGGYMPAVAPITQQLTAVRGVAPQATSQSYGGGYGGGQPYPVYLPYPQQQGYQKQQDYGLQPQLMSPFRGYNQRPMRIKNYQPVSTPPQYPKQFDLQYV